MSAYRCFALGANSLVHSRVWGSSDVHQACIWPVKWRLPQLGVASGVGQWCFSDLLKQASLHLKRRKRKFRVMQMYWQEHQIGSSGAQLLCQPPHPPPLPLLSAELLQRPCQEVLPTTPTHSSPHESLGIMSSLDLLSLLWAYWHASLFFINFSVTWLCLMISQNINISLSLLSNFFLSLSICLFSNRISWLEQNRRNDVT